MVNIGPSCDHRYKRLNGQLVEVQDHRYGRDSTNLTIEKVTNAEQQTPHPLFQC